MNLEIGTEPKSVCINKFSTSSSERISSGKNNLISISSFLLIGLNAPIFAPVVARLMIEPIC